VQAFITLSNQLSEAGLSPPEAAPL
jgi:hypothetical protein